MHFVAVDLSAAGLDRELDQHRIRSGQLHIWIAEGLLMYFPPDIVCLFDQNPEHPKCSGSQLGFTFMEKQRDGDFDSIRKPNLLTRGYADAANRSSGELHEVNLLSLYGRGDVIRFFDHNDLRKIQSGLADNSSQKET